MLFKYKFEYVLNRYLRVILFARQTVVGQLVKTIWF